MLRTPHPVFSRSDAGPALIAAFVAQRTRLGAPEFGEEPHSGKGTTSAETRLQGDCHVLSAYSLQRKVMLAIVNLIRFVADVFFVACTSLNLW